MAKEKPRLVPEYQPRGSLEDTRAAAIKELPKLVRRSAASQRESGPDAA
jgi:hypothetical protein